MHNIGKLTTDMSHGYILILPAQAQLVAPQSCTRASQFFPHLFMAVLCFSWRLVQPRQAVAARLPWPTRPSVGPSTRGSSMWVEPFFAQSNFNPLAMQFLYLATTSAEFSGTINHPTSVKGIDFVKKMKLMKLQYFTFLGEMQRIAFRLMLSACVCVCVSVCVSVCLCICRVCGPLENGLR